MKNQVDRLLEGSFTHELPALLFSTERIRVNVKPGEAVRGELFFGAENEQKIRGYITSSDRRLVPALEQFSDTSVHLLYGVDAKGLSDGDTVTGRLVFTTSIGEYTLPFEIHAREEEMRTYGAQIRDLSAFADLARKDFREAYRLFNSGGFESILEGQQGHLLSVYAGLSRQPVTYQHVEEFLIAAGLKEPVGISMPQSFREIYGMSSSLSEEIRINRSGWGHLRLDISAEGSFLEVDKHVVTDEDFIGTVYRLEYVIRQEKLHPGNQFGKIRIRSPYEELVYQIIVNPDAEAGLSLRAEERKHQKSIWKDFVDYRCGKTDLKTWAASSHYILNSLAEAGFDYPEYRLFESLVYHEEGRDALAQSILSDFQDKAFKREDLELAGVYLFLCAATGLYRDRDTAVRRLQGFYMQKSDSFPLFYSLFKLDPAVSNSPSNALYMMEELSDRGCRNPVLYAEAWNILRSHVGLMRRISPFLEQVFLFAGRRGMLTAEHAMRFAYLSGYEKTFRPCTYRVLAYICEAFETDDAVEAICRYIMLGNPRSREYFPWYQKAVERGIRLTRVYEYYMETMDPDWQGELPKSLLMYFHYNNNSLGDNRKAFLYAYVTANKEKDPETYASYRTNMESFTWQKLSEGCINEDYAILYQEFLDKPGNPEEARAFGELLFARRIYFDDPKIRRVIVRHHQLNQEQVWPVEKGVAYPRLYTDDAVILFQDDKQRRYCMTVNYSQKKLLDERRLLMEVLEFPTEDPGLLLYLCETEAVTEKTLSLFEQAASSDAFTPAYRQRIRRRILDYYKENIHGDTLDACLKKMDFHAYASVDRKALLSLLIERGLYQEALAVVEEYGCEGLDNSSLLKLTSRSIIRVDASEDEELLSLAFAVYSGGVHDETLLRYLMQYRMGSMDDLLKIWKSARAFDLDTWSFEERILQLLMFTHDYRKEGEKILESYMRHAGNERVIGAYLTHVSFGIFVREFPMSPFIRDCLSDLYNGKWTGDRVCRLALFKAVAKEKDPRGLNRELKKELLEDCRRDGLVFSFFRRLDKELLEPLQLDDKTFVECHASPDARVILNYSMDAGLGGKAGYQSRPLHNMYEGIFVQTFTMFYGETLRYYFEIEEKGQVHSTAEKVITMNKVEGAPKSKYQQINQLLSARRLGKGQDVTGRLRKFLRQEQFVKEMFTIDQEV